MKSLKDRKTLLYFSLAALYLIVAVVAFIFSSLSYETVFENGEIISALLALSSLPYFLIFVIEDGFHNPRKSVYAAFGIIGVALGVTCFFLETEDLIVLNTICMIRGIFDIVRLTIILTDIIPTVLIEKHRMEAVDIFVSIGEAIIAVFLIIKGFDHVRTHFFYMGWASVILLVKYIISYLYGRKLSKNEKSSNSN